MHTGIETERRRLDILGVQAFVAVAELASFSRAAEHLHLSQTALSRRISKLEDAVGGLLITRTTRNLSLTPAGAAFLPRARRIVRDLSAALHELRDSALNGYGNVVFGCLPTVTAHLMSDIIAEYGKQFPRNRLRILDRSATEIRQAVLEGDAEFGISVLSSDHSDLMRTPLYRDPVVVACHAKHPFAGRRRLQWRELEGQQLIGVGALSGLRLQTESVMREAKLNLSPAYEVQHLATAVGLVARGAGIAILPQGAFDTANGRDLRLIPLASPAVSRQIELFKRHDHVLSPAAAPLYDLVQLRLLEVTATPG
ncbi:LysR family transcriptional regulator [Bordetella genomosp. 12]|nr:LysR family transcriptional regulator [Bordetella genomosp. 12]